MEYKRVALARAIKRKKDSALAAVCKICLANFIFYTDFPAFAER